jgi:hypothetical protein
MRHPAGEPRHGLAPEVVWRPEAFGFVLYDPRADHVYQGNRTGRDMLRLLERGASVEALSRALLRRRRIEPKEARSSVTAFLRTLAAHGLLRAEP